MRISPFIMVAVLLLGISTKASAASVVEQTATTSCQDSSCNSPPALTVEGIADFLDQEIPKRMKESHIMGTTLAVVKGPSPTDNESIGSWLYSRVFGSGSDDEEYWQYSKGYGLANAAKDIAVDPYSTLFRPGSISKMFLWTSIMQLVDQGKVDLNEDICTYLRCSRIPSLHQSNNPENYSPITVSHLMSHTPGFEDYLFNLFVKDEAKIMNLEESISFQTLKRVREPGSEVAYSNFGSLLAGRIVEVVSGLNFEEYCEKNIFEPLNMKHSTFRQPLPEDLVPLMSEGYAYNGDEMFLKHFEFIQGTPAGGLSSTANDLAKFMKAHLSVNTGGGILKPATMKQMQTLLYQPDPRYPLGFAYGLMDMSTNGIRVIGHGGDTLYFHSLVMLIPEHNLGIFFSFNTGVENGMPDFPANKLSQCFLDHFFPSPTGKDLEAKRTEDSFVVGAGSNVAEVAVDYTGRYNTNRRSESDMLKVNALAMSFDVKSGSTSNTLLVSSFMHPGEGPREYVAIDKHLFQEMDGQEKLLFLIDDSQAATHIFCSSIPLMQFSKCAWWETKKFNIAVAASGQISIILGFVIWFLVPIARFVWSKISTLGRSKSIISEKEGAACPKQEKVRIEGAKIASRLGSTVVISYFVFYGSIIYISVVDDLFFGGSLPRWPFFLPWVSFLMGLPLPAMAVVAWVQKYWGPLFRIYYTFFAVAVQGLFWFLFQWRFVARGLSQ